MRRSRRRLVAAAAAVLASGAGAAACGSSGPGDGGISGDRLHIYSSQPLSGDRAEAAADVVRAQRMALAEAGGRAGRFRLTLTALDSADRETGTWDPGRVSANARRGAQDDRTIAYLGELDTGASAISIPILNETGILQVSPSDTVAGFTRERNAAPGEPDKYYPTRDRNFARLVPPDDVQAAALVALMQDSRAKRIFIVNDDTLYGSALARGVERAARTAGLAVAANRRMDPDEDDPAAVVAELQAARADALVFAGGARRAAAALLPAAHRAQPGLRLFAPDALADPAFVASLGPAAEGAAFTAPTLSAAQYPPARADFARRFRARHGHDPAPEAFFGHEAMSVVIAAIRRAGNNGNDRDEVIQKLLTATKLRRSVIGTYSLDRNGDINVDVYGAYRVREGRLAFDRVLDPFGA